MKFPKIAIAAAIVLLAGGGIAWQTGMFNKASRLERNLTTGTESAYEEYILWLKENQPSGWESRIQELQVEAAGKGIPAFEATVFDLIERGELGGLASDFREDLHASLLEREYGPALYNEYRRLKETSPEKAVEYLESAAETGHPPALLEAGQRYLHQDDPGLKVQSGVRYLQKAAEAGLAEAQYQLGILYLHGEVLSKNSRSAAEWLYRASRQNHPLAMYETGLAYVRSPRDTAELEEGRRLLEKALQAGVTEARLPLARQLLRASEEDQAMPLLWQLAFEGNGQAVRALEKYDYMVRFPDNAYLAKAWPIALLEEDPPSGSFKLNEEWASRVRSHYVTFLRQKRTEWKSLSSERADIPHEWLAFDPHERALEPYAGLESDREEALSGDPDAAFSLFRHFQNSNHPEESLFWLNVAAELKHKEACWNLYLLLKEQEGELNDLQAAEMEHFFQRALRIDRHPEATLAYAMQLMNEPDRSAIHIHRALWDSHLAGNSKALPMLRQRLAAGIGFMEVDKDWIPSIETWAEEGDSMAMLIAARELLSEVPGDTGRGFSRSAFRKNNRAENAGDHEEKVQRAVQYLERAIASGNLRAMEHYLWLHLKGTPPARDAFEEKYENHFNLWSLILNTRLREAYSMLEGKIPFDPETAYTAVANWENPHSLTTRWIKAILEAVLWKEGMDGVLETAEAIHQLAEEGFEPAKSLFPKRDSSWWEDHERNYASVFELLVYARQGDPPALTHAAQRLIQKVGENIGKYEDIEELALDYLDEAVEEDFVPALVVLSDLYYKGKLVRQDTLRSVRYLELAAEAGDLKSQESVGYAYGTGTVVAKDPEKAMRFLSLAMDQGSQTAKELLDRLELADSVSSSDEEVMDWLVENKALAGDFFPVSLHVLWGGSTYPVDGYSWGRVTMWDGERSVKVPDKAEYIWFAEDIFHPATIEIKNPLLEAPFFFVHNGEKTPLGPEISYRFDVVSESDLQDVLVCLIQRYYNREYKSFESIGRIRSGREKSVKVTVKNRYSKPTSVSLLFFADGKELLSNARVQPLPYNGYDRIQHWQAVDEHIKDNREESIPARAISEWPQIFRKDEDQMEVQVSVDLNKRGAIQSIQIDPDQQVSSITRSLIIDAIRKMQFLPALKSGEPQAERINKALLLL